jgi:hypothetical protein
MFEGKMTNRWEQGSFYQLDLSLFNGMPWLKSSHVLYASGRDALKGLVIHGVSLGWKKLFIPSYYCHEVTSCIKSLIPIEVYSCNFLTKKTTLEIAEDEAVIGVEYFGARSQVEVIGGVLILDVTHDPCSSWNYSRVPDFTFASLRKACFLPDGGCLWSDSNLSLPDVPKLTSFHKITALLMLQAMVLKTIYLSGRGGNKKLFLDLYRRSESIIASDEQVSAPSELTENLLPKFEIAKALEIRSKNCEFLKENVNGYLGCFSILESSAYFVMLFKCANLRLVFSESLVNQNVYPITLWRMDEDIVSDEDKDLSERVLMIHCDARYTKDDMGLVGDKINQILAVI